MAADPGKAPPRESRTPGATRRIGLRSIRRNAASFGEHSAGRTICLAPEYGVIAVLTLLWEESASRPTAAVIGNRAMRGCHRVRSPTSFSIRPAPLAVAHFMRVRLRTVYTNPLTMAKAGRRRTTAFPVRSRLHGASHRLRTAHCTSLWLGAVRGRVSHHLMREPSIARSTKRNPGSVWSFRRA